MTDNDRERRRHQRVSTSLPVRISTIEPERDPWTGRPFFRASHETCSNVSRGGALVVTHEPFLPGQRLLFELTLPQGRHVEAIGRIAWTERVMSAVERTAYGVGIEFLGGASEQFNALDRFIADESSQGQTAARSARGGAAA